MAMLSMSQVAAYAKSAGFKGYALEVAVAVAMAESGGNTVIVNKLGCVGLWQIYGKVHRKSYPSWTNEWLKMPGNNAAAAYTLSQGGKNWKPWETYTNGTYKKFLSKAKAAIRSAPDLKAIKAGTPPKGKTAGRALSIAASQIGYSESPPGSNRTKYWSELSSAGLPSVQGGAWCGGFCAWVLWKTGFTWPQIKSMMGPNPFHVATIRAHAKRSNRIVKAPKRESYDARLLREARNANRVPRWTRTPKPGYLAIFNYSHVELVEKVLPDGRIQTIGGNTSPSTRGSQNNGGSVARKRRSRSSIAGFVRIDYDEGGTVEPTSPDWTPGKDTPSAEMKSNKLVVNGQFNASTSEVLASYFGFSASGLPTSAYWKEVEKVAKFPVRWQDGVLDKETVMFLQYATWQKANGVWNAACIRNIQEHLNEFIAGKRPAYSKWGK